MSQKTHFILSGIVLLILLSYFAANFTFLPEYAADFFTGHQVMSTRLVIVAENQTVCDFNTEQGWNLVSFPCIVDDADIAVFLPYSNYSYGSVRQYLASDPGDPWKSYNPNLPSWVVQDLGSFSRAGGYWIYFDNTTHVYINSTLGTPTLINLLPGWNMIGYPSTSDRKINDTFSQIVPNFDYVYMYNASDTQDNWKEYTWNSSLPSGQDLNYSSRYYGYWVYMLASDTLVISG